MVQTKTHPIRNHSSLVVPRLTQKSTRLTTICGFPTVTAIRLQRSYVCCEPANRVFHDIDSEGTARFAA
jgi:hypothetical protein